jgi:Zn-dependent protease with chaperone function
MAMDNGAIWVFSGLLDALSDDEIAIVLGHELTHYTHEHGRRKFKHVMLAQAISNVTNAAMSHVRNPTRYALGSVGASLALQAWVNGYSRSEEDQADRVGLRYAYEGGFDVSQAPGLWARFRAKYGEPDRVSNFLVGDHSRPTERIRNLNRELSLNYSHRPGS